MSGRRTIERSGLADRVYEAIEERILDVEYEPGTRLVIDQLARELGVSTTPVRDALTRMAAAQMIGFQSYRGFTVLPEPTLDEIAHSFEARAAIEPFAAAIGCLRVEETELVELEEIQAQLASQPYGGSSSSYVHFVRLNKRFHELLVATSGNKFLGDALRSLCHDELIARSLHDRGVPDLADIVREHEAIVAALRARDPAAAEAAAAAHVRLASGRMLAGRDSALVG
jgi:DNA-binding GntR family transcriptional regulator